MLMMRCPTILNSVGIGMNAAGFAYDLQVGEKDEDPNPVPTEVFAACGGALLLPRELLVGGERLRLRGGLRRRGGEGGHQGIPGGGVDHSLPSSAMITSAEC